MKSSSRSSYSCPHVGMYDDTKYCPSCQKTYKSMCKAQTEASRAPLCYLPPYMASRYAEVRRAAKARFIELREEVVYE